MPARGYQQTTLVTPGVYYSGWLLLLLHRGTRQCTNPGYRTYTRNRPGYTREYTVPNLDDNMKHLQICMFDSVFYLLQVPI